jgi:hypothetical protein
MSFEIEREHLAWSQAALFDDAIVVELDHSDLRAGYDQTLSSDLVATRPQPVAIQSSTNVATV